MRIVVAYDRCDSNGLCEAIAPSLFQLDDSEDLQVLAEHPDRADWDLAQEAARACPKLAITLADED